MLSQGISRSLILLLFLVAAAATVQSQNSREISAVSYLERGASWMKKGEIDRAIAHILNPDREGV